MKNNEERHVVLILVALLLGLIAFIAYRCDGTERAYIKAGYVQQMVAGRTSLIWVKP